MQTIIPWSQPSSIPRVGGRRSRLLAAVVLLPLLLAACVHQASDSPTQDVTPSHTAIPQKVTPTASLHPTISADSEGTIDHTTRPTPELVDEPVVPTSGPPIVGEVPAELLDDIITDLAERLEISADEISNIQARAVEWNDGSLGCPQPGLMYIQVITPGFRVVLLAKDQMFDYHTDTNSQFILCNPDGVIDDPLPLLPIRPGNNPPKCKWPPCK